MDSSGHRGFAQMSVCANFSLCILNCLSIVIATLEDESRHRQYIGRQSSKFIHSSTCPQTACVKRWIFNIFWDCQRQWTSNAITENPKSEQRPIIVSPGGSFRLPICCFISKPECVKGDHDRKLRPNFALFDLSNQGEMCESILGVQPRSKPVIYSRRGVSTVWKICVSKIKK